MASETKIKSIIERMSDISNEVGQVKKTLSIQNYKAVAEADILKTVKPLERKYGVYSYPYYREIVRDEWVSNSKGGNSHIITIKTVYRFVNIDKMDEFIDIVSFSTGVDMSDKAEGKAMTYGDKYALLKAYKIATGMEEDGAFGRLDDDEPEVNEDTGEVQDFKCTHCGKIIHSVKMSNGSILSPKDIAERTMKSYGAPLCMDCAKEKQSHKSGKEE